MLRAWLRSGGVLSSGLRRASSSSSSGVGWLWQEHHPELPPDEFDKKYIDFFNREDIDGWMVRKGMTDLQNADVIPEPTIVSAALRACRRVNDLALAVRFLEAIKLKCGPKSMVDKVWPWMIQEIRPTLDELGIPTPDELGYDKPELFQPSVHFWEHRFYKEYGFDKQGPYWDGGPKYIF